MKLRWVGLGLKRMGCHAEMGGVRKKRRGFRVGGSMEVLRVGGTWVEAGGVFKKKKGCGIEVETRCACGSLDGRMCSWVGWCRSVCGFGRGEANVWVARRSKAPRPMPLPSRHVTRAQY